jgi:hypothetical protein
MKQDEGAVEFGTVLILFFLVTIGAGGILFAATSITYTQRNNEQIDQKIQADILLDQIVNEMQPLKEYTFDAPRNHLLEDLCLRYQQYDLQFIDVSSGYHLNFLTDEDLSDKLLADFIFINGNSGNFTTWRNMNGLTTNKNNWREYVNEEAWKSCVSYGWLHKDSSESFARKTIVQNFGTADINLLFPLLNDFPLMNINMIDPKILKPLVMRPSFNIDKPEEKLENLIQRLMSGPLFYGDISASLQIPVNHPLMRYLGTKTAFWKLHIAIEPSAKVSRPEKTKIEAIVAALPQKNGERQEIAEYRLIDRVYLDD